MLSRSILRGVSLLAGMQKYGMNHIKNMNEQHVRVRAQEEQKKPMIEVNLRVYKPSYTIEFNREGEVLLYSGNPIKNETIYFKYPYVFYESFIPLSILNYVINPFEMVWYWPSFFLYFTPVVLCARIWYWTNFMYHPNKIFLLRGGRVLRIEAQSLGNERYIYWVETQMLRPLTENRMNFDDRDNAEFLTEEGQLKHDLSVQAKDIMVWGCNLNEQQLHFKKHGVVHHPELFEASLKGFNIDTTDFVINTADNIRYREGNHDQ